MPDDAEGADDHGEDALAPKDQRRPAEASTTHTPTLNYSRKSDKGLVQF